MNLPSVIPLSWKIGAAAALVGLLALGHVVRVHAAHADGRAEAIAERAANDAKAVAARIRENAVTGDRQDAVNTIITKAKNEELAPVLHRIAADRVRVGPAICGPAAPAKAESAAGGDRADPPGRLVREDIERDLRALKEAVEQDLATGRACQAFVRENGLTP